MGLNSPFEFPGRELAARSIPGPNRLSGKRRKPPNTASPRRAQWARGPGLEKSSGGRGQPGTSRRGRVTLQPPGPDSKMEQLCENFLSRCLLDRVSQPFWWRKPLRQGWVARLRDGPDLGFSGDAGQFEQHSKHLLVRSL